MPAEKGVHIIPERTGGINPPLAAGEADQSLGYTGVEDDPRRDPLDLGSRDKNSLALFAELARTQCQTGPSAFFFSSSNFSLLEKSVLVGIAEQTLPQPAVPRAFVLIQINEHKAI